MKVHYSKARSVGFSIAFYCSAVMAGCARGPRVADPKPEPFYEINPDLLDKAEAHGAATIAMVDSSGILLYRPFLPWGGAGGGLDNYLASHNIADAPSWHGVLMQALAFQWAETGESKDAELQRLAGGFVTMLDITGVPGLLARSSIGDYTGPRLSWMATEEQRPTKFWQQGTGGRWFRNGVSKDHWNMAVCGVAVPLALERAGSLHLSDETRTRLVQVLVAVVRHLVDNGYRIRDATGKLTEFGDLRPHVTFGPSWPELPGVPNGFNQLVVLNALKASSYYADDLAALYHEVATDWTRGIKLSMTLTGVVVAGLGHSSLGKPSYSDMQAYGTAATSYLLMEDDPELRGRVHGSLLGLWSYMQHEVNPPFSLALARHAPERADVSRVVRLLRFFPGRDGKRGYAFEKRDTSHYQPIENRPPNTHVWKSSPFRVAIWVDTTKPNTNPATGDPQEFAASDYLYAYYLGRLMGLVPKR